MKLSAVSMLVLACARSFALLRPAERPTILHKQYTSKSSLFLVKIVGRYCQLHRQQRVWFGANKMNLRSKEGKEYENRGDSSLVRDIFNELRTQRLSLLAGSPADSSKKDTDTSKHDFDFDSKIARTTPTRIFLLDGGTGEELFRRGVPDDRKIWSATAVVHTKYHNVLKDVHRSFMEAGSMAITTNSYGIVPGVGFNENEISKYASTSARLARECVQERKQYSNTIVCGSLGPLVESYRPDRIMAHDDGVEQYKVIINALNPLVDCFIAETISSYEEMMQVVEALGFKNGLAKETSKDFAQCRPLLCSFSLRRDGHLRDGERVTSGVMRLILSALGNPNIDLLAVMFNCCEPEAITDALKDIRSDVDLCKLLEDNGILLGAYANRLTCIAEDWTLEGSAGPQDMRKDLAPKEYYHSFVRHWTEAYGVQLIGGCCGMTPEHIQYIRSLMLKAAQMYNFKSNV